LKFRKYDPMGCRKAVKADQKGHRCITKSTPETFQDQRCDQRHPQKSSRGRPKAPEAPQRPTEAKKYEKP